MLCERLSDLIGVHCTRVTRDGRVALVETPFRFADGDAFPLFAKVDGPYVTFFDDCGTREHFHHRGVPRSDERKLRGLKSLVSLHGVSEDSDGQFYVSAKAQEAPAAFARMVSFLIAVAAWEKDLETLDQEAEEFVSTVEAAVRRWHAGAEIVRNFKINGVTRQPVTVDLAFQDRLVFVCRPSKRSAGSALRKIIDVNNSPEAVEFTTWAVVDDRKDIPSAEREEILLSAVTNVVRFSNLERYGFGEVAH